MPLRDRLLHISWLFFFLTLPLSKALSSIAEVVLIVLTLYRFDFTAFRAALQKYRHVALLTLFFLVLIAGLLYTENLSNGWRVLRHQHRILVIPLLFLANAGLVQRRFRQYLLTFIAAVAVSCIVVIVLYLLPQDTVRTLANSTKLMLDYPDNLNRAAFGLYSPFIDRIQLSSLIALATLSSIYLLTLRHLQWLQLLLLPLLLFTILILGGRGGQLSLLLALAFYASAIGFSTVFPILSKKTGRTAAAAMLTSLLLLLFIGGPWLGYKVLKPVQARMAQTQWELEMYRSGEYKNHDYTHFTTLRRIVSWQNMWEVVKQNPLLGTGTGDYLSELEKVYAHDAHDLEVNSHNQYLLVWGMNGLPGLLVFLFILGYWLYRMLGFGRLSLFAAAFLLFYLLNMIPDTVLFTQVDSMAFCAFFSLIGLQRPEKHA